MLTKLPSLGVLKVPGSAITLENVIKNNRASSKVRILEVIVAIDEDLNESNLYCEYVHQSSLPLRNRRGSLASRSCYAQIGSQSILQKVSLKVVVGKYRTNDTDVFKNCIFPGIFNLSNNRQSRPGYLGLSAGLTKLKVWRGSVSETTEEAVVTVGRKESFWLQSHLSAMKDIELVANHE
ncbi:hypothetical protein BG015_000205 [Linnemannia schmuckeri]|uniref:Uncharacterized protein n=1 Tax=Linnemannia schmuckeri TaxID=64567 RepID=A0A9P5RRF4_9FUNG|nr:hypothetical protein BG015_000205 [Linnemannia schmuckeri]